MERLGDDELLCIFDKIPNNSDDRITFLQVSKRFMKVAGVRRKVFIHPIPRQLFNILPSSPNIKTFICHKEITNTHLKLLAHCPNLLRLNLNGGCDFDPYSEFDFDDGGLCAVANACIHLQEVYLRKMVNIGDAGVAALATSCKDLKVLRLENNNITDESLKAIARSGIVDLQLCGCDRITDSGIIHLKQLVHLTRLELGECGVHITDIGIVPLVSQLSNIKSLGLSGLKNITDVSLLAIGTKCLKLETICFDGCEAITGQGVRGFRDHPTLKGLMLLRCYNFCWADMKSVVLTCMELLCVKVMKTIMTPMPEEDERLSWTGDNCYSLNGGNYCLIVLCDE